MRQNCLSRDKMISATTLKRKDDLEEQGEQIRDAAMQGLASTIIPKLTNIKTKLLTDSKMKKFHVKTEGLFSKEKTVD